MRAFWRYIMELVRPSRLDRESAEELTYHLDSLVEAKRRSGLNEAEARRQARLELGSVDVTREQLAEGRIGFFVEQTVRDVLYALRVLRRVPGVTALSIATMGIGIGMSTMLFALVSSILLRPLPYSEPEQLVRIFDTNLQLGVERAGAASGNIDDWRRRSTRFHGITGFYSVGRTLSTAADAEVVITAQVSQDFFPLFRVSALLGRTFSDEETRRSEFNNAAAPIGPDPVAVIAYQLWQRQYGADPAIIGRTFDEGDRPDAPGVVMVSDTLAKRLWPGVRAVGQRLVVDYSTAGTYPYEVVGVVKDVRFGGPRSEPLAEIYLAHAQRSYLILNVTLRSTVDPRTLIPTVRQVLKELDPHKPAHGVYPLEDLVDATIARDRQAMLTLLMFACAAVALAIMSMYGVLSQRVRERSREIGIRIAMSANRSQVIGWVATRGLRMIALGIAAGLASAWALTGALSGLLFGVQPADPVVALVSVGLLLSVGLIAALLPSWRATRIDPVVILRRG